MHERNDHYYARYPGDRERVRDLHSRLAAEKLTLPNGDTLTGPRLRTAGTLLGASDGAEHLHYILELPPDSPAFGHDVQDLLRFNRNPIYALIHEACYADGHATRWSSERVMPAAFTDDVTLFTGEHLFPWMLDEYHALKPLKDAANLLAEHEWPRLYDEDVLRRNDVKVAAAVYVDDPYVESGLSMETVNQVRGMRAWLTNEYLHNAIRADGDRVLGYLFDMADGRR
jgi:hypothetical protein